MCERTSVGRLGQDSCQRRRSWGPNLVGARLTWRQQGLAGPFPPSTLPCPETSVSAEQRLLPSLPRLPSLGPYFLPVVPEALCHCPGTFLPGPSQGPRPCYPSPSSPLHLLAPVVPGPRAPPPAPRAPAWSSGTPYLQMCLHYLCWLSIPRTHTGGCPRLCGGSVARTGDGQSRALLQLLL